MISVKDCSTFEAMVLLSVKEGMSMHVSKKFLPTFRWVCTKHGIDYCAGIEQDGSINVHEWNGVETRI